MQTKQKCFEVSAKDHAVIGSGPYQLTTHPFCCISCMACHYKILDKYQTKLNVQVQ